MNQSEGAYLSGGGAYSRGALIQCIFKQIRYLQKNYKSCDNNSLTNTFRMSLSPYYSTFITCDASTTLVILVKWPYGLLTLFCIDTTIT